MVTLADYWAQFIFDVLFNLPDNFTSSAGRKYVFNPSFSIPGEAWLQPVPFTVHDLGYQGQATKMKMLKKVYYNEEGIKAAKEKLSGRIDKDSDFNSVLITMAGGEKDKRSQGHCMASTVITHLPARKGEEAETRIDIYYRVTEVLQKFGADLLFLHDIVLPELLDHPDMKLKSVNFFFSNVFFSPLFLPVMYPYMEPTEILKRLYRLLDGSKGSMSLFKSCCRAAILPMVVTDPEHYNYRTRRLMHHLAIKHLEGGLVDREGMIKFFEGKPEVANYLKGGKANATD